MDHDQPSALYRTKDMTMEDQTSMEDQTEDIKNQDKQDTSTHIQILTERGKKVKLKSVPNFQNYFQGFPNNKLAAKQTKPAVPMAAISSLGRGKCRMWECNSESRKSRKSEKGPNSGHFPK